MKLALALLIAAASDLRQVLPEVVAAHERGGGAHVEVTFGSSGKLAAQIANGAPFDAFFSADAGYVRDLEARGLTRPGTRFVYAVGSLVLWAPPGGLDPAGGLGGLAGPGVARVAIANPAHAPYGRAAREALQHAKVWAVVEPKLALGENAAQAAQFAAAGAAQAALIPRSLLGTPGLAAGRSWPVPPGWHEPLIQEAVVLRRCERPGEADAFFAFVRGKEGQKRLATHGFGLR